MKIEEGIEVQGKFHVVVKDKEGNIKFEREYPNLITNAGKAEIAKLITADVGGTAFDYIAIGSDDGTTLALDASNTALGNELARAAATGTTTTTNVTDDTMQLQASFTGSAYTIEEIGVFNASTGGTMLSRILTGTITLQSTDTITITYKLTVS